MLQIERMRKVYGSGAGRVVALEDISFSVGEGEFVSLVGPSGCGKTTLMLAAAGLQPPTDGSVRIHGREVTAPLPDIAVVFQDYARSLFPWLTSSANIELPLKDRKLSKAEIRRRTAESLDAVGLGDVGERYPWQMSGGMQQRVAIARALALSPTVLLMDEPFASVDAQTRSELEDLLQDITSHYEMTVMFVTHDIDEAVYLSDRVVVLSPPPTRVLEEVDVPLQRPRDQIFTKRQEAYQEVRSEILTRIKSQRGSPANDRSDGTSDQAPPDGSANPEHHRTPEAGTP